MIKRLKRHFAEVKEAKDKQKLAQKCTDAVNYLTGLGIEGYEDLSFSAEEDTYSGRVTCTITHARYGSVLEAVWIRNERNRISRFNYGNWADKLAAYYSTVYLAEKKKQREDTIARFSDIKEE